MGLFSSIFGKKTKTNLTPEFDQPAQENLFFTQGGTDHNLRDLVSQRLFHGEGLGFGPDFLSKATNPAIASREARFNETELPQLSSQLSARGLARSAGPNLATDVLTRAGQNKERDINDLLSQFYVLNEQQKKSDFGQALGEANLLQGQQAQLLANRASASERQVGRNLENDRYKDTQTNADIDAWGGLALSAALPMLGPAMGMSAPTIATLNTALNNAQGYGNPGGQVGSQILGSLSDDDLGRMIMERQFAKRMGR